MTLAKRLGLQEYDRADIDERSRDAWRRRLAEEVRSLLAASRFVHIEITLDEWSSWVWVERLIFGQVAVEMFGETGAAPAQGGVGDILEQVVRGLAK